MSDETPPLPRILRRQRTFPAFLNVLASAAKSHGSCWSLKEKFLSTFHSYARCVIKKTWYFCTALRLAKLPEAEDVIKQSRVLCREYIYSRLKKQGLLGLKLVELRSTSKPSPVSQEIKFVGGELEHMYPDLYKNISKQLNITMGSESIVRNVFAAVAEQILKDGKDKINQRTITWAKVVSLFAVVSAFAVDCVSQGHAQYVSILVDAFEKLISKNLVDWIIKQGGWPDIIRTFRTSHDATVLWALSGCGMVFGATVTLMATL